MSSNKTSYMLKYPTTSSSSSRDDNNGLKLPPISSMDNFLPTRIWNPPPFSSSSVSPKETSTTTSLPTPPQPEQWKSPPYSSRNELTRDSLYKSPLLFSSTNIMADQQQQKQHHSPTMQQHHNKPLESSSYFQYTSKAYHFQQQQQQKRDLSSSPASSSNSYYNATVNKVDQDIDQVVLQCNTLCDNMMQHKDQFINTNPEQSSTRPLLDDMIGRANEVLNALLRLRKHQIASEQYQSNLLQQQAAAAEQQHHHHLHHHQQQQQSNNTEYDAWRSPSNESVTNINNHAKQRKRGKRPQFRGRCHSCNISETPEWRRGPDGARTLCNACGLHYAKLARKQQENRGMSNNLLTTPPHRRFSTGKLTPPADEIIIDRSPTG